MADHSVLVRASLLVDNVAAIVPNQKFITDTVKNWQHTSGMWQLRIALAAKYSSDLDAVRTALYWFLEDHLR